jgi:glycosyltransferase involved in cell wall biosynthesis
VFSEPKKDLPTGASITAGNLAASYSPPGVTVVITAYNYAGLLAGAIRSVLVQDYPLVEIMVVDDGSTDNTRQVVEGFGERVRYLYQQNAGLSAARNTGIWAARHGFIAFLDADDEWHPGMLSAAMRAFSRLPQDFGLVACSCRKLIDAGIAHSRSRLSTHQAREIFRHDLILMNRFAADSVVVRRDVFEKSGYFDTELTSSEDRDMWIRLAEHGRIFFLPDVLVTVRVHAGSMSRNPERMKLNMSRVLLQARQSRSRAPSRNPFFWAKVWAIYHYQVAWMYMEAGLPVVACQEILRSWMCYPVFLKPGDLRENKLFRFWSLMHFLRRWLP